MTYTPPRSRDQLSAAINDPWRKLQHTLAWAHGPERAEEIINGTDLATNRDLVAWRALGGRAEA